MLFFVSIVKNSLAPFDCVGNPTQNSLMTLRGYPTVVCYSWNLGYPYHMDMVIIGVFANLMSLAFLAGCVFMVRVYPQRVRVGDMSFLRSSLFLTTYFHSRTYWFALVLLVRDWMLAFTSTLTGTAMQITYMLVIYLAINFLTTHFLPFRTAHANILLCCTDTGMLH